MPVILKVNMETLEVKQSLRFWPLLMVPEANMDPQGFGSTDHPEVNIQTTETLIPTYPEVSTRMTGLARLLSYYLLHS